MYETKLVFSTNGYEEYTVEVNGTQLEVEHTMGKFWFQGSAYESMEAVHAQITRIKDVHAWMF